MTDVPSSTFNATPTIVTPLSFVTLKWKVEGNVESLILDPGGMGELRGAAAVTLSGFDSPIESVAALRIIVSREQ